MNNNKYYNFNNLLSFKPDIYKVWNFYKWTYSPNLIIDLSLSFFHQVTASNDIHIYYKNPKIGNLYVVQVEIPYKKYIYHHGTNEVIVRLSPYNEAWGLQGKMAPISVIYYVFLCTTGDGMNNNKIYLDMLYNTASMWEHAD